MKYQKLLFIFLLILSFNACEPKTDSNSNIQTIGTETFEIIKIPYKTIWNRKNKALKVHTMNFSTDGKFLYGILKEENLKLFKYDIKQQIVIDSINLPYKYKEDSLYYALYALVNSRDNTIGIYRVRYDRKQDNHYYDLYILNSDLDSDSFIPLNFPNNHLYETFGGINAYYKKDSCVYIISNVSAVTIHDLKTKTVRYADRSDRKKRISEDSIFDIISEQFYLTDRFKYVKQYDTLGNEVFSFNFGKEVSFMENHSWYYFIYDGRFYYTNPYDYDKVWDIQTNDTSNFQRILKGESVYFWCKDGVAYEKEDTLVFVHKIK